MIRRQADLVSPAYLDMQKALHADPEGYGTKGRKWADSVAWLMPKVDAFSVLDYGCGQGSLAKALLERGIICREYDPAVKGKDGFPGFADLVVCTDVLEHVEIDKMTAVLNHIQTLARKAILFSVALDPSAKILTNGENAHITLRSAGWWDSKMSDVGLSMMDWPDLPLPKAYDNQAKRDNRWIAVVRP